MALTMSQFIAAAKAGHARARLPCALTSQDFTMLLRILQDNHARLDQRGRKRTPPEYELFAVLPRLIALTTTSQEHHAYELRHWAPDDEIAMLVLAILDTEVRLRVRGHRRTPAEQEIFSALPPLCSTLIELRKRVQDRQRGDDFPAPVSA